METLVFNTVPCAETALSTSLKPRERAVFGMNDLHCPAITVGLLVSIFGFSAHR